MCKGLVLSQWRLCSWHGSIVGSSIVCPFESIYFCYYIKISEAAYFIKKRTVSHSFGGFKANQHDVSAGRAPLATLHHGGWNLGWSVCNMKQTRDKTGSQTERAAWIKRDAV